MTLGVEVPAGFTFSVETVDYVGSARLFHLMKVILYLAHRVLSVNSIARLPYREI